MATSTARLELDNSQFLQSIRQSEGALSRLKTEAKEFSATVTEAFGGMNVATSALGAALVGLGVKTMQYADDVTDMAAAHGESVTQILALGKALSANGGRAENVGRLYMELAKNIDAANNGNLKTVASFERLGVSIQDLGTATESQIRDKLIKGIADIQDPAERSARAFDIFGKAAMNVDFTGVGASLDKNLVKMAGHEESLKAAADAYDKLGSIMTDIKLAAADVFYPFFVAIKNIKIDTEAWVAGLKAATVALAALAAASVVKGVFSIVAAFAALSPIGRVLSLLAAGGTALAASLGLFGKAGEAYDKLTGAAEKNTDAVAKNNKAQRDTSAIEAAREKESQVIRKITEAYLALNQATNDRLVLELQGLSSTEEQQKIAKARVENEVAGQKALLDLKNQFLTLDGDAQKRQMDNYLKQQSIIKSNIDLQNRATASQIANIEAQKRVITDQAGAATLMADQFQKEAEARSKIAASMQSIETRNRIEANYNLILQERSILSKTAKDLLPSPQAEQFASVVTQASAALKDYSGSASEMAARHRDLVTSLAKEKGFTDAQIKSIYQYTDAQNKAATLTADRAVSNANLLVQAAEATNLYNFGLKTQYDLSLQLYDLDNQRMMLVLPELEKRYKGIEDASRKTASTEIQAAQARLGRRLTEAELDEYYKRAERGNEALKRSTRALYEESRSFATGWKQAMNSYIEDVTNGANAARNIFTKATQGMEDAIVNFVKTGKFEFRDFMNSMLEELLRSQIRQIFARTMSDMSNSIGSGGGGGGGDILGTVLDFGKNLLGFANGGTIPTNGPVIVGERGPELLFGAGGMTVDPRLGGGGVVNYYINAVDAPSFRAMIARDPSFIHAVSEQGRRSQPGTRR